MANDDYYSQIAQLRQERRQREQVQRLDEVVRDHAEQQKYRDEAAQAGDADSFECYDDECERLEREFAQLKPPGLSNAKQKWLGERWDLPRNQQTQQLAASAHAYVTALGIPEDSEAYFSAMATYLEPSGYQKPVTPNDVCSMLGVDARTYNKGVAKLAQLKASGAYRDR